MADAVPCPHCGNPVPVAMDARPRSFPFCAPRCRILDLGAWASDAYVIPGRRGSAYEQSGDESTLDDART